MALSVGELFGKLKSYDEAPVITAGTESTDMPVLRIAVIDDNGDSVGNVRRFDAVVLRYVSRSSVILSETVKVLKSHGTSGLFVCADEFATDEMARLREECDGLALALIELGSAKNLPALISRLYEELERFYENEWNTEKMLMHIIGTPELYRDYSSFLKRFGFFENSDYCAADYLFVPKYSEPSDFSDINYAAMYIGIGVRKRVPAATVLKMNCHVAVILPDAGEDECLETAKSGIEFIPGFLRDRYKIFVGLSDRTAGIRSVPDVLRSSVKSAALQKYYGNDCNPVRFAEQGLGRFIISLCENPVSRNIARETLGKLELYDMRRNTRYLSLLKVYFRCNCSLKLTASEMYMHKNTVIYGLRKIESILGCRLDDLGSRSEMMLMLGIMELSGEETGLLLRI